MDAVMDFSKEVVRQWWQRLQSTAMAVEDCGGRRLCLTASVDNKDGGHLMAAAVLNGCDDGRL